MGSDDRWAEMSSALWSGRKSIGPEVKGAGYLPQDLSLAMWTTSNFTYLDHLLLIKCLAIKCPDTFHLKVWMIKVALYPMLPLPPHIWSNKIKEKK